MEPRNYMAVPIIRGNGESYKPCPGGVLASIPKMPSMGMLAGQKAGKRANPARLQQKAPLFFQQCPSASPALLPVGWAVPLNGRAAVNQGPEGENEPLGAVLAASRPDCGIRRGSALPCPGSLIRKCGPAATKIVKRAPARSCLSSFSSLIRAHILVFF